MAFRPTSSRKTSLSPQPPKTLSKRRPAIWSIGILINNAGERPHSISHPDDAFQSMVDLNLTALFRGMRAAARIGSKPTTRQNRESCEFRRPGAESYLRRMLRRNCRVQLTRTCAVEWAPHNINVNAIGPGYVRTEMTAHTLDSPEAGQVIRTKTALGRPASPSEIVGAAIYLCSAASSYTTGHILMVDGGWTAL